VSDAAVFAAVADPTRWEVLRLLVELDGASASALSRKLPVSRPAVIKHLHVLDRARLVTSERAGREVRYLARPDRLAEAAAAMAATAAAWDRRLTGLKRSAER
jgi:DNA-binding transcriptional ArsR family regulator